MSICSLSQSLFPSLFIFISYVGLQQVNFGYININVYGSMAHRFQIYLTSLTLLFTNQPTQCIEKITTVHYSERCVCIDTLVQRREVSSALWNSHCFLMQCWYKMLSLHAVYWWRHQPQLTPCWTHIPSALPRFYLWRCYEQTLAALTLLDSITFFKQILFT